MSFESMFSWRGGGLPFCPPLLRQASKEGRRPGATSEADGPPKKRQRSYTPQELRDSPGVVDPHWYVPIHAQRRAGGW